MKIFKKLAVLGVTLAMSVGIGLSATSSVHASAHDTDDWYQYPSGWYLYGRYTHQWLYGWQSVTTEYNSPSNREVNAYSYIDQNHGALFGWQYIDSNWYYLGNNGYFYSNTNGSGHWQVIDGGWYYFRGIDDGNRWFGESNGEGSMVAGWLPHNGSWYLLSSSGAMLTGWQWANGNWYFLNDSGSMSTGWIAHNGSWYYTNNSGAMQTGWQWINGNWYYFDASGAMLTSGNVGGWTITGSGAAFN
ncbi:N-acetylmuramoyl-L-alanine amidase family protein [Furfurilactobacillus milii]|uniref:N-acetylmuramoyl-L-alanine amidase family protein n=1 Tax=Furfurilactobacillus rossiae TaxID=231049 RepID=A0A7C9ISQ6_9LACO|nr:N-acetylmuramoyl-L-alanine amidase family protein [Furfurilactobacillus milii]MYV05301.1 hypothetical protein [Furfurilactobacillus milii]